ncbi:MAG: HNH endonuclease [Armatimonadota bacterium]
MGKKAILRRHLYDLYADDLAKHTTNNLHMFACPICLRLFDERALNADNLTLEHVIPYRLRGNLVTLTCKECNNRHGASTDIHLINRLEAEDGRPLETVISNGEDILRCVTSTVFEDGKQMICFTIDGKRNNPQVVLRTHEIMSSCHVNISYGYAERPSRLAELKCAYLALFAYFGYDYLAYAPGEYTEAIRRQLLDPTTTLFKPMLSIHSSFPGLDPIANRKPIVLIITDPPEAHSIHVLLNLSTGKPRYHSVAFPGFGENTLEMLAWWDSHEEDEDVHFKAMTVPTDNADIRKAGAFPSLVQRWFELTGKR